MNISTKISVSLTVESNNSIWIKRELKSLDPLTIVVISPESAVEDLGGFFLYLERELRRTAEIILGRLGKTKNDEGDL